MLIGFTLYLIGLLANSYYFLIDETFIVKFVNVYLTIAVSARNGVFVGFLFIGIGVWISNNKILNINKLNVYAFIMFICSFILYIAEVSYIFGRNAVNSGDLYVMLPMVAASLFICLSTIDININVKTSRLLRKLSTGIYFLHYPIRDVFNIYLLITGTTMSSLSMFLIVTTTCLLILLFVYRYSLNPFYKLLS